MTAVQSQPKQALLLANQVRMARAAVRSELRTIGTSTTRRKLGFLHIADIIEKPAPEFRTWPVGEALILPYRAGAAKVSAILREAMVSPNKPIGELTERQRGVLTLTIRRTAGYFQ